MSYADQQALSVDSEFTNRVWAALASEGRGKDATDPLVAFIMANPFRGVNAFMPYLATAPGFDAKYVEGGQAAITDGDLLAAIQAVWPLVQVPS